MVLVALVIDLIEGHMLFVVCQLKRDVIAIVIGCKDFNANDCCFAIRLL